ncbi:MAG TPA: hypothetical protein IAD46_05145 [Candidatus Pelethenecus faecipullorum]|uniref:Uncharacterized protein n=1 Tax=Candidatus Pelethenecus faecipullorum TaxID=2840900 RepID=A0A9D1GRA4_9MOLU|nr:hypothetical protein [Candidatus Pelethenecus faecipullorum]
MQNLINNQLLLSFWGYRRFGQQDTKSTVEMWKDAGFNTVLSFIYPKDHQKPSDMIELLDLCAENNLKVILYDDRIHCHRLQEMSEDEYEKAVIRSVKEFGNHPAAVAFFVSDEPNKDTLPLAEKAVQIVQKHSPIPAFVNFYPMWRSKDYVDLVGVAGSEIDKLYSRFIKNTGLGCLAYDCYGAMSVRDTETEMNVFFDNLNTYYKIAKKTGVPLVTSLLCTGHWSFKQPNLSDLRWQISVALAHGVKGVQWFMLYDNDEKLGDSPIDIYNERQPSYYDLRKVNREFLTDLGDLIPKLELEEVYHYAKSYGGTQTYAEGYDEYLKSFTAKYRDHAIISRFRHKETGRIWYMFVNTSRISGNLFQFRFASPYEHCSGECRPDIGRYYMVELKEEKE